MKSSAHKHSLRARSHSGALREWGYTQPPFRMVKYSTAGMNTHVVYCLIWSESVQGRTLQTFPRPQNKRIISCSQKRDDCFIWSWCRLQQNWVMIRKSQAWQHLRSRYEIWKHFRCGSDSVQQFTDVFSSSSAGVVTGVKNCDGDAYLSIYFIPSTVYIQYLFRGAQLHLKWAFFMFLKFCILIRDYMNPLVYV